VAANEQAAKDQPVAEAGKDQAARAARDQAAKDQAASAAKDQAAQAAKEQAAKEQAAKEQAAKEQAAARAAKERAAKERAAKERAAKEAAARPAKEQAPREQVLQDQILSAVKTGQEATLHLAKTWVETVASVTPKPFGTVTTPKLDDYYGFAERLWSRNCDFVVSLLEIATAFGKSVPEAGKATTRRR
jgi:hypothetical protein